MSEEGKESDEKSAVTDEPKEEATKQGEMLEPESSSGAAEKPKADEKSRKKLGTPAKVGIGAACVAVFVGVLFATHVLCIHQWEAATCTTPETCKICGRTQGDPLGHDVEKWDVLTPASCTSTGTEQGRCTRCGELQTQQIDMLPHTEGDWEVTKDWTINSGGEVEAGEHVKKCTVCGTVLETEEFTPDLTASQKGAAKMAGTWAFSGSISRDSLIQQIEMQGFSEDDATMAVDHCGADWNAAALKSAKQMISYMGMSRSGLINELELEHFTEEQATYAADQLGL